MDNYLRRAGQVLLVALAWFVSGYVFVGAVSVSFLGQPFFSTLALQGGLVNLILSLIVIALVTATPVGNQIFFEGAREGGGLLIWLIFALPIPCLFVSLVWTGLSYLVRVLGG